MPAAWISTCTTGDAGTTKVKVVALGTAPAGTASALPWTATRPPRGPMTALAESVVVDGQESSVAEEDAVTASLPATAALTAARADGDDEVAAVGASAQAARSPLRPAMIATRRWVLRKRLVMDVR